MKLQDTSELIQSLEIRIYLLQRIIEIAKKVSLILDLDVLFDTSINSIRELFAYDSILFYVLDDSQSWAVLKAGTGQADKIILAHNYKVEINGSTLIGWCIQNRKARLVLDGEKDAENFKNPLKPFFPNCECNVVFPLISRDKVIGALEIYTLQQFCGDFDKYWSDLQAMIDHIAIALDNARLFGELQKTVEA